MEKKRVVVIGAGKMGSGISAAIASHGTEVTLVDTDLNRAQKGVDKAKECLRQLVDAGLVTNSIPLGKMESLVIPDTAYERHLPETWLIIEAVFEDVSIKTNLFKKLDATVPKDIILASNTSGMMLKRFTEGIKNPERTVITHFWFPGHLVPLVEVVRGEHTEQWVVDKIKKSLLTWGKSPVVVNRDLPGQLANRILQAIIREAINIVDSGLATAEDVDTAIKMGMALRFPAWGPLEHIDAVGLDLAYSVQKDVLPGLNNDPIPPQMLKALLDSGALGFKSGKGFYDWSVKDMVALEKRRDDCIISNIKNLHKQR